MNTIEGNAFMENVNLRCEMHGEDKVGACDLTFKIDISANELKEIAGADSKWLILALFNDDTGTPRLYTFKSLSLNNKFENYTLRFADEGGIILDEVGVDHFKISELKDNQCSALTFRVKITPNKDQVAWLFEQQREMLKIVLSPRQGELLDGD